LFYERRKRRRLRAKFEASLAVNIKTATMTDSIKSVLTYPPKT